ncbi:hypothetical protein [Corynebacterium gerontici]|uniref:Substrate binding domain of ABC-type glycine betaine transport system n=1 Tax=Corynebacterium gerontici TaxID=2079234 RepID=A0A3G6IZQ5_9CORY|nr:hypothetical protein [Corynebacterium gerontici]AZA11177.1 hypothetical protein CGERO_04300 [Corynebacterium gerontici]
MRVVLPLAVVLALGLGACASQEPNPPLQRAAVKDVVIGVERGDVTSELLAELYAQALHRKGRMTEFRDLKELAQTDAGQPVDFVAQGQIDLTVSCTGAVLALQDPNKAGELSTELQKQKQQEWSPAIQQDWSDATYEAMVGTLPGDVDAADPSRASSCKNSDTELPLSIVPIYKADVLNRQQRVGLNWVSGSISNEKLQELRDQTKSQELGAVVAAYLDEVGLH